MEGQDLVMPDSFSSNSISSSNHEKNIFCEATMSLQKFSTHALDSSNPKWNTSGEIIGMVLTYILIFILVLLIIATIRMT